MYCKTPNNGQTNEKDVRKNHLNAFEEHVRSFDWHFASPLLGDLRFQMSDGSDVGNPFEVTSEKINQIPQFINGLSVFRLFENSLF